MCESNPIDEMASFEVLQHQSLDLSEFSLVPELDDGENHGNGNLDHVQLPVTSVSQDVDMDIETHILQLAQDNAAMKEALDWNNKMMKEQLSTISAWHNQMTTSMSKQQWSLKEATDRVDILETENARLRAKLEQVEEKEISTQDSKGTQTNSHSEDADRTIAELKLKIEEKNLEIANLEKTIQEKDALIEISEAGVKESAALKSKCLTLEDQLKESCKEKEQLDLDVRRSVEKISDLETDILRERQATEIESIKHSETKKLYHVLLSKHNDVMKELNKKKHGACHEGSDDKRRYLEQIDNLTARLFDMEEQLAQSIDKADLLTSRQRAFGENSETIKVLESQIQVYNKDLERVKLSKEEADAEIQTLNQVIENLQSLCKNAGVPMDADMYHRRKSKSDKLRGSGARQGPKLYTCPLCNFGFTDAQAVQNHANKCLDEAK